MRVYQRDVKSEGGFFSFGRHWFGIAASQMRRSNWEGKAQNHQGLKRLELVEGKEDGGLSKDSHDKGEGETLSK